MDNSRAARIDLIGQLEKARGSRVLCYVTGDRQGMETKIGDDIFSSVYDHLELLGQTNTIDLFVYSTGGVTMAGWGLVKLLRKFCKTLNVLVPFKAHSCATLIALGADSILMGKLGQLSPIDPSVNSPYNPSIKVGEQQQLLPVSVEDVIAYLHMAEEEAGIKSEVELGHIFGHLVGKLHPLALGAVYRAREQIRTLGTGLLKLGQDRKMDEDKIKKIMDTLTIERMSHDYLIDSTEAKEIGLNVTVAEGEIEGLIWKIYKEYEELLKLTQPYSAAAELGAEKSKHAHLTRAIVESRDITDAFITERVMNKIVIPPQQGQPFPVEGYQENQVGEGWKRTHGN